MKLIVFIAMGGAVGAVMRYGASMGVYGLLGRGFPYGTLFVNVAGSLLMGLLSILFLERFNIGPEWRAAILVGLLGSFTTFSTFSIETLTLLQQGESLKAFSNMFISVLTCMIAVWMGVNLGKQL